MPASTFEAQFAKVGGKPKADLRQCFAVGNRPVERTSMISKKSGTRLSA